MADKIYQASRLSSGNFFFPCRIELDDEGVKIIFPGLFRSNENLVPYSNIATISLSTPLIGFTTITFNVQGVNTLVHGFRVAEAREIQKFIQGKVNLYKAAK